jgi:hydrogenase nickel incorporation protein HypB
MMPASVARLAVPQQDYSFLRPWRTIPAARFCRIVDTIDAGKEVATVMCEKCGCSSRPPLPQAAVPHRHDQPHDPAHGHAHEHAGDPADALLAANDRHAERNRGFFRAKGCFVLNLLSFGASHAAALVARLDAAHGRRLGLRVLDAARLTALGAAHGHAHGNAADGDLGLPAMDAHMIGHALDGLDWNGCRVLVIVNGGSAVCQAVYDLGEHARAVVFSVHEGERKPLKTPLAFEKAALVLINDCEAAEACGFNHAAAMSNIRQAAPDAGILEISPQTGAGLEAWRDWLAARAAGGRQGRTE